MARVAERRVSSVDAAWIESALVAALTEISTEAPKATGELAWKGRDARGHVAFAIHVSLVRASEEEESAISLVVELEPSLGRSLANALPLAIDALVNRRPAAALEQSAATDIAEQDMAGMIAQSFWEAFEGALAGLARQPGAYR